MKPVISSFNQIAPILIQQYERYLPSAFDESMSLVEKVNKVIEYMNQIGLLTADVVTKWNEVSEWLLNEGLEEGITNRLDELVADGTLSSIINNTLFAQHMENFNSRGINVKLAGAIGDGATDDTEILQGLLNDGYDLFIPNHVFLTGQLNFTRDEQMIHGVGTLKLKDSAYSPVIYGNGFKALKVRNIGIDGNASGNPLDNGAFTIFGEDVDAHQNIGCVTLENCSYSLVELNDINNAFASPVIFKNCQHTTMRRNKSLNHRREGFGIVGGNHCHMIENLGNSDGLTLPLAWSQHFTNGIAGTTEEHHHKVIGNIAINSQAAHMTINSMNTEVIDNLVIKTTAQTVTNGPGIRLGHDADGMKAHNNLVKGNKIYNIKTDVPFGGGAGKRGISCDNAHGSIIEGNYIEKCSEGIGVSVVVDQTGIVIRDNTIKETVERAINAFATKGVKILNNMIETCDVGIHAQAFDSFIKDNTVTKATTYGIRSVAHTSGIGSVSQVINNAVVDCGLTCVYYDLDVGVRKYHNINKTSQLTSRTIGNSLTSGTGGSNLYIAHNLPTTPTFASVIPTTVDAGATGIKYIELNATHLVIHFMNPSVVGTSNLGFKFMLEYN